LIKVKRHAMKTYEGVEILLHAFLFSAIGGDAWSASRPGRFNPKKEPPGLIVQEVEWAPEPI
jgi:hypothetical protein